MHLKWGGSWGLGSVLSVCWAGLEGLGLVVSPPANMLQNTAPLLWSATPLRPRNPPLQSPSSPKNFDSIEGRGLSTVSARLSAWSLHLYPALCKCMWMICGLQDMKHCKLSQDRQAWRQFECHFTRTSSQLVEWQDILAMQVAR